MAPRVELLWWEGCPSTGRALEELRAALADVGLDPAAVQLREVSTDEQAQRERFAGSPTFLIDGADVFPTGEEPAGLTCRIYRTGEGRVSPTPGREQLRDALARLVAA
jgi:hypothetical protein